jgi:alkaline phosphatase D
MSDDGRSSRGTDETERTRRDVLDAVGGSLAAGVAATLGTRSVSRPVAAEAARTDGRPTAESDADVSPEATFPQSVASGDPEPDGVLLWTRVAPGAYDAETPLYAEVARDEAFDSVVGVYEVPAARFGGDCDHTVKLALDGDLSPDETYYYRFSYDGVRSRVGRCRTLPAADASPERVRFAVCTCQDYRNGFYGAYGHVADDDVDFLLHLGDFIYESGGPSAYDGRGIDLPSGGTKATGLADFRHLHRTYRSDEFLQRALRRHTLVATWDDHEIVNNRYWDYEADAPGCGPEDHPASDDPAALRELFADGMRAWWEYVPARVGYDPDADLRERLRLYRHFRFGDLLDLLVTDERLYRSEQPGTPAGRQLSFEAGDGDADADQTMLGAEQLRWFETRLDESDATWTGWANEVLGMAFSLRQDGERLYNADAWDGYEAERRRLVDRIRDVDNFVAMTGDMHTALAGYLQPTYPEDEAASPDRVGVEFMTPALTSVNLAELLDLPGDEWGRRLVSNLVRETNPHVRFFDSHHWGYATVEFAPDACTYTAWAVDKASDDPGDRRRLAKLRVPVGDVEIRDV